MLAPTRASEEYEAQKRLTVATLAVVRSEWDRMGSGSWWAAWDTVGPRITAVVAAGQIGSARSGAQYVPEVLEEQGMTPRATGQVNARAFGGWAADGRSLDTLLPNAVAKAQTAGTLDAGRTWLDMVVESELADAHRGGIQTATAARPRTGYVRMVNSPCCKDCAVQAGKFFRVNAGFLRHPFCKCYHLPTTDPRSQFATYPEPHEITGLSPGERKALEAGGDYSQVLNASRGESKNKMTTTEGTTRRGSAYKALGSQGADVKDGRYRRTTRQRLTPDGIYRLSSTEDEARRLLKANGYLL